MNNLPGYNYLIFSNLSGRWYNHDQFIMNFYYQQPQMQQYFLVDSRENLDNGLVNRIMSIPSSYFKIFVCLFTIILYAIAIAIICHVNTLTLDYIFDHIMKVICLMGACISIMSSPMSFKRLVVQNCD